MEIRKLTRADEDFYAVMGPVFGSRLIEKQTKDRFYDDAGKVWYAIPGKGAASLLGNTIKNFWAVNADIAEKLITAIQNDSEWFDGVLPRTHESVFSKLGFDTRVYRTNFIEVYWHEKD